MIVFYFSLPLPLYPHDTNQLGKNEAEGAAVEHHVYYQAGISLKIHRPMRKLNKD
jgi:hypothetical protein